MKVIKTGTLPEALRRRGTCCKCGCIVEVGENEWMFQDCPTDGCGGRITCGSMVPVVPATGGIEIKTDRLPCVPNWEN